MSYVIQDGDKWYWLNPTDAREGDEHLVHYHAGDAWEKCDAAKKGTICNLERRRLIAPGDGWRILNATESLPRQFEVLYDIKDEIPKWTPYTVSWGINQDTVKDWYDKWPNIIAIRQRIPVEAWRMICSFCQWSNVGLLNIADFGDMPKYICHGCVKRELDNRSSSRIQHVIDAARALVDSIATRPWFRCEALTPLESALAALDKEPTKDDEWPKVWITPSGMYYKASSLTDTGEVWSTLGQGWAKSDWNAPLIKDAEEQGWKRVAFWPTAKHTPAEAQARMEGKE